VGVPDRELLTLEPMARDPEVGRWLAAMEDCRRDTLRELAGVTDAMLDVVPSGSDNSVATLLYHVALVEADWLLADIFLLDDARSVEPALLPFVDRDREGHLTAVSGESLAEHVVRLAAIRAILLERLHTMPATDFHQPRRRDAYDVTPNWVVHHLLQHEAEHRSELVRIKRDLARS
jgi:hypothetical protein